MAQIHLCLDPDRVTWGDLIVLDEWSESSERARRDTLAHFVVDEDEQPLSDEDAQAILGALPLSRIAQVKDALNAAILQFKGDAVPSPSSGN